MRSSRGPPRPYHLRWRATPIRDHGEVSVSDVAGTALLAQRVARHRRWVERHAVHNQDPGELRVGPHRLVEQVVPDRDGEQTRRRDEAGLAQNEQTRQLSETTLQQNEQMKKVSSWAAILFAPTLIGTVYGMNFDHMPELHWVAGYPLAVGAMVAMGGTLYAIFKTKKWL